ncbi:MAG: type II toxin-antitoxin system VapC family toxin [Chloroflexi bacterium]|nr:type II toxin-antitoxin system VapC family toxin [Chloroflexota bacterium]
MTFLIDANIVVYAAVDSAYRAPCLEIVEAVARRTADGKLSTAVFEEIWHIELSGRAGALRGLAGRSYTIFTPLLSVTDEIVARARALDVARLGANDRIHVSTALANGITTIVTADADFDGVPGIRRVDPRDDAGRLRLLTASAG